MQSKWFRDRPCEARTNILVIQCLDRSACSGRSSNCWNRQWKPVHFLAHVTFDSCAIPKLSTGSVERQLGYAEDFSRMYLQPRYIHSTHSDSWGVRSGVSGRGEWLMWGTCIGYWYIDFIWCLIYGYMGGVLGSTLNLGFSRNRFKRYLFVCSKSFELICLYKHFAKTQRYVSNHSFLFPKHASSI